MEAMLEARPASAPDLIGLLSPPALAPARLTLDELDDAITALVDREEVAGVDERARLRRVRDALERQAAALLAE